MREIRASDAKTHLPALLHDVERGETIIITRHGRPIARMVPEKSKTDTENLDAIFARMRRSREELREQWRKEGLPPLTIEEIIAMKHEGHRY